MENTTKRVPKGDIKFAFSLSEEQKEAKRMIRESEISIITGNAGSGKSGLCANTCLDLLFTRQFNRVILTRPTVEVGKSLGFLPGSLGEKFDPYLEAFIDNLHTVYPYPEKITKLVENGQIDMWPIQFIRGKTVKEGEILIVEEAQQCTKKEIEALFTRLGKGGKIIINGDEKQKDGNFDGLEFALELSRNVEGVKHMELKDNHRSGLVGEILNYIYR